MKRLFTPPNPPLPDLEEIGHALFDPISERLVSETTAETAEITPTEIRRRAAMLITRGRA